MRTMYWCVKCQKRDVQNIKIGGGDAEGEY